MVGYFLASSYGGNIAPNSAKRGPHGLESGGSLSRRHVGSRVENSEKCEIVRVRGGRCFARF